MNKPNSEKISYLGAVFFVTQDEDGSWGAYYRGCRNPNDDIFDNSDRLGLGSYGSREAVIEEMKRHLDQWGVK